MKHVIKTLKKAKEWGSSTVPISVELNRCPCGRQSKPVIRQEEEC